MRSIRDKLGLSWAKLSLNLILDFLDWFQLWLLYHSLLKWQRKLLLMICLSYSENNYSVRPEI